MGAKPSRCVQVLLALRHRVFQGSKQVGPGIVISSRVLPEAIRTLMVSRQALRRWEWPQSDGWTVEQARLRQAAATRYFAPFLQALEARGIPAKVWWDPEEPWPELTTPGNNLMLLRRCDTRPSRLSGQK